MKDNYQNKKRWGRLTMWLDPRNEEFKEILESWYSWIRSKGKGAYLRSDFRGSCVMVYQIWE